MLPVVDPEASATLRGGWRSPMRRSRGWVLGEGSQGRSGIGILGEGQPAPARDLGERCKLLQWGLGETTILVWFEAQNCLVTGFACRSTTTEMSYPSMWRVDPRCHMMFTVKCPQYPIYSSALHKTDTAKGLVNV